MPVYREEWPIRTALQTIDIFRPVGKAEKELGIIKPSTGSVIYQKVYSGARRDARRILCVQTRKHIIAVWISAVD
jgi:hypothetical protein